MCAMWGGYGCVTVAHRPYHVGLEHKGKTVALLVDAPGRCFEVWEGTSVLKRLPIKGVPAGAGSSVS